MDLSAISTATNSAAALAGLILATPQNVQGITAQLAPNTQSIFRDTRSLLNSTTFIFHVEGENSITLETDITDHVVEDNTPREDQMALRPIIVQTNGFISELNDVVPPLIQPLKLIADSLLILEPYLPSLSATALEAYNEAVFIYQTGVTLANGAISAYNLIGGESIMNKQQQAFAMFMGYWSQRQLFTVNTPWGQFKDMGIKFCRPVQDASTRTITNFEVTFKRISYATVITSLTQQGRLLNMANTTLNQGTSTLSSGETQNFDPSAVTN